MSRVTDLLEAWSKDPAYAYDLAQLARDLRTSPLAGDGPAPAEASRIVELVPSKPGPVPQKSRRKARVA